MIAGGSKRVKFGRNSKAGCYKGFSRVALVLSSQDPLRMGREQSPSEPDLVCKHKAEHQAKHT